MRRRRTGLLFVGGRVPLGLALLPLFLAPAAFQTRVGVAPAGALHNLDLFKPTIGQLSAFSLISLWAPPPGRGALLCALLAVGVHAQTAKSPTVASCGANALTSSIWVGSSGNSGDLLATGLAARINSPTGLAYIPPTDTLVFADKMNRKLKTVPASTGAVALLAGSTIGDADGTGASALLNDPDGVAWKSTLNAGPFADWSNYKVKWVTTGGVVTTLAGMGNAAGPGHANGAGAAAKFSAPSGVAVVSTGDVYVGDGKTVRKVTQAGVVTTVAGQFASAGNVQGALGINKFNSAFGVALSSDELTLFITDIGSFNVRSLTLASGVVAVVAGSGISGATDGAATAATFTSPRALAVDTSDNLYVGDNSLNNVRLITATSPRYVRTIVTGINFPDGIASGAGDQALFVNSRGSHVIYRAFCSASAVAFFAYTGWDQYYYVPPTCTQVRVNAWGGGGAGNAKIGGDGAFMQASVTVTPGSVLTVVVGAGGQYVASTTSIGPSYGGGGGQLPSAQTGSNCAQGGGRSAVRVGGWDIVTAGGGGSSGGFTGGANGGKGGDSSTAGSGTSGSSDPSNNPQTLYAGGGGLSPQVASEVLRVPRGILEPSGRGARPHQPPETLVLGVVATLGAGLPMFILQTGARAGVEAVAAARASWARRRAYAPA